MPHPQTTPEPARVADDLRIDYVALATNASAAWSFQTVTDNGPDSLLAQFPADAARRWRHTAAQLLEIGDKLGARVIVPGDDEWPAQLEDLNHSGEWATGAPLCLWARGPQLLPKLASRSIFLTGSRAASPYGTQGAQALAYDLADGRHAWTIANAGQFGIDAAALHAASVAIERTAPLVVLPCGIDRSHPHLLAEKHRIVADTGLLLSAEPPGATPSRAAARRALDVLAALTTATVIVEALRTSVCMPSARRAAQMNRPVLAVPGPVTSAYSTGCHQLIRDGIAHLVTSGEDIHTRLTSTTS